MPKEEEKEYLKILGVDKYSPENEFEIKRAYKKLALRFHPDKNQSDFSASNSKKQFDEISKAFESLTLDYRNDTNQPDYDQIFFDFLRDIFDWREDAEGAGTSNFLTYFCGSKQHPCSSDGDFDSRYQDTEDDEDVDGEGDLDSIMEIIKNRKKKGKHVPEEFKEENLMDMKSKLNQHKEDMKRDATKKQSSKKGKMPVPVAKPKPKSKKQLQAEQRRREKEMEKIAVELEEKRKEEVEKEKQRKQLEVEKQKRLEEERIKAQNEERKRREKEQKERERQQKLEQEKEEKRRRQQEEEKKRREEEEKRKKAEKEKAEKEKAARKAAQQAAKEKEDKEKAANKNQNMKRLQQQQRTDQQQYPREIPPRFQKKMKQQQQQSQYQTPSQQMQQQQSLPQQTKPQPKQPPAVNKKKDPNRFGPKEFADMIEPVDDSGWSQSAPVKGSGWGNSLETWEDADKWGSEDRQWGDKEGTWDKLVVDEGDKDTWPSVGSKGAIGDKIKTSSLDAGSEKDITGTSCWDNVVSKSDTTSDLKTVSSSKVSQWLESTGVSLADLEWGQENLDNDEGSEGSLDGWTTASKRNRAPKPANDSNAWMNRSLKQLLDMGFKQEDAEKALKANHMNIESAIGDLLAMNMSENREQSVSVPSGKLQEPDPAEAARIQQQQQQGQGKLNRKQRRKLQQQQQAEQQTLESKTEQRQGQNEVAVSKSVTQVSESVTKPASEQQNKTSETQSTSKTDEVQQDSKTKTSTSTTKPEKPPSSVAGAVKPTNGQSQLPSNGKRSGLPVVPPAPGPGVQGPLRPTLAHPLLHPQFVQQLHLQQLRMAQGGLLQPPFTPQQFAMLQQIAQLQLVQQRLAAQSVAQQHLGQKQQVVPQQQLYQQQQQIALMIAQMQQQVLQQQPGLGGRHPALPFTAVQQQQQQQSLLQQQQQQQSPNAQQKGNKAATNDKPATEAPTSKTADTVKSQPSEPSAVSPVTSEEQPKQPSPVTQSRLTQWKQPLLHEPSSAPVTQSSVTSSTPASVDSKAQTISAPSQSSSGVLTSVVSAPSISTSDLSDSSAPNSNNVSPRARIPDPVSSRWGVDAGPKLSADPPEFKPGVPWRPAPKSDKRDEVRDSVSPNTVESSSRPSSTIDSSSDSWSNLGNQTVSAPSSVQLGSNVKVADNVVTTIASSSFSGLLINNHTFESSQIDFGAGSTPWLGNKAPAPPAQVTSRSAGSSAASLLRPPPGLGSDTTLPESPLFDEEPPAWLKSLIDGSSLGGDKIQPEFQFSRFGFANSSTPWSPRDSSTQPFSPLTPNPQPWAAVGGPAPTLSSSASSVTMATSENRSGSVSTTEPSSLQNSGIIWSTNQPIPSAEEKLSGNLPGTSVPPASASSGVAPSRTAVNSMSTWLVLRNLSPRMDPKTLRPMCERHGPLLTFQLNLRHGNSLIRYGSMEEAAKARAALNGMMLVGSQVAADFATDSDIGSFFEQTMDWSANPFPSNTYGNQWSFQNVLGSAATSDNIQSTTKAPIGKVPPGVSSTEQPIPKVNNPTPGMQWGSTIGTLPSPSQGLVTGEQSKVNAPSPQWVIGSQGSEQPGAKPNTAAPSVPWGSAHGHAPAPSYLWGTGPSQQTALGGNFSQVPSMWSFPAGVPRDVEPQSGSGDGLVSPSMTTFLPPGLLNGGGDSV